MNTIHTALLPIEVRKGASHGPRSPEFMFSIQKRQVNLPDLPSNLDQSLQFCPGYSEVLVHLSVEWLSEGASAGKFKVVKRVS